MKEIKKQEIDESFFWKIAAFDIETWGLNANKFAFGVVKWISDFKDETHYKVDKKVFFNKDEMGAFLLTDTFAGYRIYSHNGGKFDLIGLYQNYLIDDRFDVLMSKGRLISMTFKEKNITFLDSLNLFPMSLSTIGKSLRDEKFETPLKFITGDESQGITEKDIDYCIQDVDILLRAILYFQNLIYNQFHVNLRLTIASTAQHIWNTNFLNKSIKVSQLDKIFFRNSYYGGRTELIEGRGTEKFVFYHDFNSLYPSVMIDTRYPNPENLEYLNEIYTDIKYIMDYEGVSLVSIHIPDMVYPPLPYRLNNKLIFPVGNLTGWWNHNELRTAIKYGCEIKRIYKTIFSYDTVNYFKNYIEYFYNLRLQYKKEENKMGNLITKLLMNSLYGKFAQLNENKKVGLIFEKPKKRKKGEWIFKPYKDSNWGIWELVDENMKAIQSESYNNIILFSSYTTSAARVKLYEKVMETINKGGTVYYTDTDSIISNIFIEDSKELGKLKLEGTGIMKFYAPKAYIFRPESDKEEIIYKLKGVPNSIVKEEGFKDFYTFERIITPKQSLIRGLEVGKPIRETKFISNEDDKRVWHGDKSEPIKIDM